MDYSIYTGQGPGGPISNLITNQLTTSEISDVFYTQQYKPNTTYHHLSCKGREWPIYWGPEVICYNQFINSSNSPTITVEESYSDIQQYNCTITNKFNDTNDVIISSFDCISAIDTISNDDGSYLFDIGRCVTNTSVIARNILHPVAEFILGIPKSLFQLHRNSSIFSNNIINNKNSFNLFNNSLDNNNYTYCDSFYEQLLRCDNITKNTSFYESSTFDSYYRNSTSEVFEPIHCLLSLTSIINVPNEPSLSSSSSSSNTPSLDFDWTFLFVIIFIFAGGLGNILVCLAVALDRKLQNVTNYFLLSLAIADLLVSLFVMPLGAVPGFLGEFFFSYFLI